MRSEKRDRKNELWQERCPSRQIMEHKKVKLQIEKTCSSACFKGFEVDIGTSGIQPVADAIRTKSWHAH